MQRHVHRLSNILIAVEGDHATSEAYIMVVLRPSDGIELVAYGRYLDRWSCRGGVWAIDARRYVHDFGSRRAVEDDGIASPAMRDATDPSYA
jgi:hypothetical protein